MQNCVQYDQCTLIPARSATNAFYAVINPKDLDHILRCICITSSTKRARDVGEEAPVPIPYDTDLDRFRQTFWDTAKKNPEANSFLIEHDGAASLFLYVLACLMAIHAHENRTAMVTIRDRRYRTINGFSKGFVWRTKSLEKETHGLSAMMVFGLAEQMQTVAATITAI